MGIKGTELFVKALRAEGVDTMFAYPGGMAIDLFDALYDADDIEVILPRHEQALVHAADGYARSTGKVGVCLVTSGPGATNLVTGIATANYDSVPLVCFTGQVPLDLIGNDAFQEVDIVGITRGISKWSTTVRRRQDLGMILKKAFYIARTGRPGPVLIDLPKDIQCAVGDSTYPETINIRSYKPNTGVHQGQVKKAMTALKNAKKPIFLVGGGVKISGAQEEMVKLAEITHVPVITTIMGKGAIPTDHPLYVGNVGMHGKYACNKAVNECDLLFSIGTRFNDRITGEISTFAKKAKIIHVDIDTASISRNIEVDIPIVADAKVALEKMLEYAKPLDLTDWQQQIEEWKAQYPVNMSQYEGLTAEKILHKINEIFPEGIITTDVGQNQLWTTQYLEIGKNKKLLTSGGLGTMGYGFPAAIGAQIGNPEAQVVSINGDGGFQMNLQELATAVALQLPITICILNNSNLGNVRQMQELFHHKRYSSTCLVYRRGCEKNCHDPNRHCPKYLPDFVRLAESYEAKGLRVTEESQIEAALLEGKNSTNRPTIIEFIIERDTNVYPMVPGGKALNEMILNDKNNKQEVTL